MASTPTSNATEQQPLCANCGVHTADIACVICQNAPSYASSVKASTFYCCIHCSIDHEHLHRDDCKAAQTRRILYHACETAKLIFQCCCQGFSKTSIVGAEKTGNDLHIYQTYDTDKQALPSLVSIFRSKDDKDAALACMASDATIPFLRALLEHMLSGLILHLARVDCTIKSPLRRIIMYTPDGTSLDNTLRPHSILQLTLRNNEVYAIDISGIQYGIPNNADAVVPWDIYRPSKIDNVQQVEILPSLAEERLENERLADEQGQVEDEQMGIDDAEVSSSSEENYSFVGPVLEAIKVWETTNYPMRYVLIGGWPWGTEEEYVLRRGELVQFVERSVNGANTNN